MTAPADTSAAQGHVGRTWRQHDRLTHASVARLRALLNLDSSAPPPLGLHWLADLPEAPQSQLGRDGHPRVGGETPDLVNSRLLSCSKSASIDKMGRARRLRMVVSQSDNLESDDASVSCTRRT